MNKIIILIFSAFLFCNSYNMQLLSYMGFNVESSDITGFYQDEREIAVIGLMGEDAAAFVDVTDPFNPFEISRISGTPSTWRDLKYWNEHVYIGTEADDGVKVVDVSNLDNPTLVNIITDVDNSHNIHVYEGYLYIVGADEYHMWIYDLSDPAFPELIGTWNDEYIHDLQVYNDKAYAMSIYSSTAYIIDLSDKSSPVTLVSWQYPGMAHDCAVTEDENYLVTADEMEGGYIRIWDIQDYNNITELDFFITNPLHSVHNVYIKDGLLYASWYADGVRVFDISDPSNILEIAYYDTSEVEGLYVGNWGVYVDLPSGNIVASDIETGLYVLKLGGLTANHVPLEDLSLGETVDISVEVSSLGNESVNYMNIFYSYGYEWFFDEMSFNGNSWNYEIPTPDSSCVVSYYFEVVPNNATDEGDVFFYPSLGESEAFFFVYGDLDYIVLNDFEVDSGWYLGETTAVGGIWERAIPNGTVYQGEQVQPEEDNSPLGDYCYVTGNSTGQSVGADDVDGGETSIISPVFNLESYSEVLLTYFKWFTNNLGDNPSTDRFKVQVSNDGGASWVSIEDTNLSNNSWKRSRFFLSDYISLNQNIIFKVTTEDVFNDGDFGSGGSLVEAAFDDFSLQAVSYNFAIGDINNDESLNVLDVVLLINFALNTELPSEYQFQSADINADSVLDVLDIVLLVNLILDN